MIDSLKEIFPVEAAGPLIGGALLWFGFNYVVLAPNVIVPRLVEKYYAPACIANVDANRTAFAEAREQETANMKASLGQTVKNQMNAQRQAMNGMMGAIFGGDGGAFMNQYGNELNNFSNNMVGQTAGPLAMEAQKAFADWEERKLKEDRNALSLIRYRDSKSYCNCNIRMAMADSFDAALYTSTLRLFKPRGLADMEEGRVFETECGKPPVVR